MNTIRFFVVSGLAVSLLLGSWCFAGEGHGKSAIFQMAEIMDRLKHYPSPQGKTELQAIISASSTTANERIIATAIMNLEHQPAAEDIPKLETLINDKTATQNERDIASIVLKLDHRPTAADKKLLKAMMQ